MEANRRPFELPLRSTVTQVFAFSMGEDERNVWARVSAVRYDLKPNM